MEHFRFNIPENIYLELSEKYPNTGKNSHVGDCAIEIAKAYFISINPDCTFEVNKNRIDLTVITEGNSEKFEVKGTADNDIAYNKLKVSSQLCHDRLIAGMKMMRISGVGRQKVDIYFLKYGEDFTLKPEPRWDVKEIKQHSQ